MIITCAAALLVGAVAAALTSYLPFIVCLTSVVAVGACGALLLGVSFSPIVVDAAIALGLAQVGYAVGLALMAALYRGPRQISDAASYRTGRGRTLFKQQRK